MRVLSVFLLKDGGEFYLCVDVTEFLLSRSMEKKKQTLRTLPFFGCLPSSRVYLEQKIVCLARSGLCGQASDVTTVHPSDISHLGFNPQPEPCLHTHPRITLILGCVLRKIYICTYFKQVNVREQTYSCS